MKNALKAIAKFMVALMHKCASFLCRGVKNVGLWFRQDMGSKLLAILFAFILWSYVLVTTNPVRDKNVSGLPVQVSNLELLHDRGLDVVEDIASSVTVRVTVQANNDRLNDINEDNVTVTAELSSITKEGVHRVELSAVSQYGTVHRITPAYIDINVQPRISRQISVDASMPKAENGFWRTEPVVYPATITITGARDVVRNVSAVQVTAAEDLEHSENVALTLPITILDEAGNPIVRNLETDQREVVVTAHYYPTKSVPLKLDSVLNSAQGYQIGETTLLRQSVTIAAPQSLLDEIDEISTQQLVANDLTQDVMLETAPNLPTGVVHVTPQVIRVRVDVAEETISAVLGAMPVHALLGDEEDAQAAIGISIAPSSVTVQGFRSSVSSVSNDDIQLYADVSGLRSGQSAKLQWRWVGKDAMPADLVVTTAQTVVVRAAE